MNIKLFGFPLLLLLSLQVMATPSKLNNEQNKYELILQESYTNDFSADTVKKALGVAKSVKKVAQKLASVANTSLTVLTGPKLISALKKSSNALNSVLENEAAMSMLGQALNVTMGPDAKDFFHNHLPKLIKLNQKLPGTVDEMLKYAEALMLVSSIISGEDSKEALKEAQELLAVEEVEEVIEEAEEKIAIEEVEESMMASMLTQAKNLSEILKDPKMLELLSEEQKNNLLKSVDNAENLTQIMLETVLETEQK